MEPHVKPDGEVAQVLGEQRRWASRAGVQLDETGHRISSLDDALFLALPPEVLASLAAGKGQELRRLQSLRSSTCLVLNVFVPWIEAPRGLGQLLHPELKAASIGFEVTQPTGLGGTPPHLDVVLSGVGPAVAIESKFLEMYDPADNGFRDAYFEDPALWDGLPSCLRLAKRIRDRQVVFRWLGASQLLKHALGLSKHQERGFRLVLLWYRVDGEIADEIDREIDRFVDEVGDIGFVALTYQQLVLQLMSVPEPTSGYFSYLAGRYGLGVA